ncbi:hypothetical protein [Microbulbifer thermotolerans]|uniref:hypothetical protein n=1 Tax=Microbulbifer thermotolerans TaxID=252514 RepID=UPI0022487F7C|nr:hypothetical protein [Microbulbifer thermotolerans]MCX2781186.1 hypothetical protein [Microbulbifer thermotolerans]MCX2793905.1 hypothetical protein [Microbulbifer thermotolerans]MCX2803456.1 hypothetical protein [Microbulbifer thermotolerans]MCX2840805.1 hypothetical protein [Microbulbifer thermotolerans]WKT59964.1 hypothetical protein Q2E61_13780 [Microbulbifer thermotolerans]
MTTYEEEIEGREFDWYAEDIDGNIGLFSTAGEGFIPEIVIENFSSHDDISESLDSPNWGSPEVWSDYAKLGFYVYDWDLPGGPYNKERGPIGEMAIELKNKLLAMASLPKLNIRFSETEVVQSV